ncbi:hypothetical protein HDE_02089 [Halotydeus destructor]|nr:hypothetical protein HDE_02089 [Halotydeus destructor]
MTEADSRQICYIDEFNIDICHIHSTKVWRLRGCRYEDKYVIEKRCSPRTSISIIISFAYGFGKIGNGRFEKEDFIDFLNQVKGDFDTFFWDIPYKILYDNAPIHNSNVVKSYIQQHYNGRQIPHPPYSPDLNPIEHVGYHFKKQMIKLINNQSLTKPELIAMALSCWNNTLKHNLTLLNPIAASYLNRLNDCKANQGGHTRY